MSDIDKTPIPDDQIEALDALFKTAKAQAPAPSDDLIARVLADASAQQSATADAPQVAPQVVEPAGFWASLFGDIGSHGRAVLAASAIFGISLGYFGETTVTALSLGSAVLDAEALDEGLGDLSSDFAFSEG